MASIKYACNEVSIFCITASKLLPHAKFQLLAHRWGKGSFENFPSNFCPTLLFIFEKYWIWSFLNIFPNIVFLFGTTGYPHFYSEHFLICTPLICTSFKIKMSHFTLFHLGNGERKGTSWNDTQNLTKTAKEVIRNTVLGWLEIQIKN